MVIIIRIKLMKVLIMTSTELKARPVPFLKTFFKLAAEGMVDYPAPAIENPLQRSVGQPTVNNAYKNKDGSVIFSIGRTGFSDWYVMAPNGSEAYKIPQLGFAGSSKEFKISFSDELDIEKSVELIVNEDEGLASAKTSFDEITLEILAEGDKEKLLQSIVDGDITFVGLPDVRDVEQALKLPSDDYIVVSRNKVDYSYGSLRIFTGSSLNNLREIEVIDVQRLRDGGTTFYVTKEGTLFCPSRYKGNIAATWTPKGQDQAIKVEKLDQDAIEQEIGNTDTRICGVKTWAEYSKQSGPA